MKKLILLPILFFVLTAVNAQKISSYTIFAEFFPDDAQMWGYEVENDAFMRAHTSIKLLESTNSPLTFYLHGELKIDSIVSGKSRLDYTSNKVLYRSNYSRVALETTITDTNNIANDHLEIHYSGFMNKSRARSMSDYMHIDKKEGVFLRSYGYSLWFPIFLKSGENSYEADFKKVQITLPKGFRCIVSGSLISETTSQNKYTAVWNPGVTSVFNVTCSARKYQQIEEDNVAVYYISDKETAFGIVDFTKKLKHIYQSCFRDIHQTSSLFILELTKYGDISNQNIIGLSPDVYREFKNSINSKLTIAHELVHPYVYIPVSNENPFSSLIVEGFPSFFHLYALKKLDPSFDLHKLMLSKEKRYLHYKEQKTDRRGNALPVEKPILDIAFDEIRNYKDRFILPDRVPLFLYHLWNEMGDENYDLFLKELFSLEHIDYSVFEKLVLAYIPTYRNNLNVWLNTNDYPPILAL